MKSPQIAILHTTTVPEAAFDDFKQIVAAENLDLRVESREEDGLFAALEWMIPTAVIVYIGRSYFDGFLKEMGKDHYALLKTGLKSLYAKFLGPDAPTVTVVATKGKANPGQPYSLFFSLMAEANGRASFKLLLQREATPEEYDQIVDAFLVFLQDYNANSLEPNVVTRMRQTRTSGGMLLLAYNPDSKAIEPIDPNPKGPDDA